MIKLTREQYELTLTYPKLKCWPGREEVFLIRDDLECEGFVCDGITNHHPEGPCATRNKHILPTSEFWTTHKWIEVDQKQEATAFGQKEDQTMNLIDWINEGNTVPAGWYILQPDEMPQEGDRFWCNAGRWLDSENYRHGDPQEETVRPYIRRRKVTIRLTIEQYHLTLAYPYLCYAERCVYLLDRGLCCRGHVREGQTNHHPHYHSFKEDGLAYSAEAFWIVYNWEEIA